MAALFSVSAVKVLVPSLNVTVPDADPSHLTYATSRLPALTPVNDAVNDVPLPSANAPLLCLKASGATAPVTVTTKLSLALKAPSLTVTVIVLVPVCPAAGVTLTVRLAPLPPKTIPLSGTSAGLLEVPLTVKLPTAVSMSPTVNPIAPVPVFTGMDRSAISPIVGPSFTGLTVSTKLSLALN